MNFSRRGAICLIVAPSLLSGCRNEPDPKIEAKREPPFVDIGNGSKVTADMTLRSAGALAADHDATIYFSRRETSPSSLTVLNLNKFQRIEFDPVFLELTDEGVAMNHELNAPEERVEKLRHYAEATRLSESTPIIYVLAEPSVPGADLVEVFYELLDAKLTAFVALSKNKPRLP